MSDDFSKIVEMIILEGQRLVINFYRLFLATNSCCCDLK